MAGGKPSDKTVAILTLIAEGYSYSQIVDGLNSPEEN